MGEPRRGRGAPHGPAASGTGFRAHRGRTAELDSVQTDLHAESPPSRARACIRLCPAHRTWGFCSPEQARVTAAAVLEVPDAARTDACRSPST